MKVSLVIPCTPGHAANLPALLASYAAGSVPPDQVVVSLSEAPLVPPELVARIAAVGTTGFEEFLLLKHAGRMTHGPNRQAGSERAIHELISYQDADDLPHPCRIQVVKALFARHDICHLVHFYCPKGEDFSDVGALTFPTWPQDVIFANSFPDGKIANCKDTQCWYGFFTRQRVHAGHLTIRREVLRAVRWKDWDELAFGIAEDYEFNMETTFHFRKSLIVGIPLVKYSNARA